ncbi:transglutaminase domain-containing protein [Cohnella panacarvi]|uniref:transglutaminase domain-containing protein n=1 Tax=Cohnella panacarvi TaxID=400776 RepID=UPI00047B0A4F|nr:transglutaminase domain-containing protein [Cohnella panacarvi]
MVLVQARRIIASLVLALGIVSSSGNPAAYDGTTGVAAASASTVVQQVARQLSAQNPSFTLSVPDVKKAEAIIKEAMQADEYIAMLIKSYSIRTTSAPGKSKGTAVYKVDYLETKKQTDYVKAEAKRIVAKLTTNKMSDIQKEKVLHDYIASHVTYDKSLRKYTAYEALTTGEAVCQGYALLTYRLMQEAGIPVHIVSGTVSTGLHAWNKVKLDGKWYNVDTTWDSQKEVSYSYFNVTDAALKRDHSWKQGSLPAANTDYREMLKTKIKAKDKYAIAYQAIMKDIGEQAATVDEAINVINRAIESRKPSVKFTYLYGRRKLSGDIDTMLKKHADVKSMSISYSYSNGIATIEAKLGY